MPSVAMQPHCTPEEYLALERSVEYKNEYRDGRIVPMELKNRWHCIIVGNVAAEIGQQLKARPCEAHMSSMRLKVSRTGLYTYPDVFVICGEVLIEDEHNDTLLNPTLIVEVFSPTTEAYDRGEKFAHYRRLESLQEYVLVAQDKVRIESYVRQGAKWVLSEASSLDETVRLESIGCELALRDVYDKVQFGESDAATLPQQDAALTS
jgi:Uma2 family endonuclease